MPQLSMFRLYVLRAMYVFMFCWVISPTRPWRAASATLPEPPRP